MCKRASFKTLLFILLVFLITPSLLYAGWIEKEEDGSVTYISDGKIKWVQPETEGSYMVLDYKDNRVVMVDGSKKSYAAATIDEYCQMMQNMLAAFGEMDAALGGEEEDAPESVKVVAAGKDRVAGMEAEKYKVYVDGELYEEVWLASDAGIMKELGNEHEKFMDCLSETDDPVESSKAYQELSKKGWELRSISYDFGEKDYNSNVVEIKKAAIPDSEFDVPGGYKKMKLEEFFNTGME